MRDWMEAARAAKGLSQTDVAKALEVTDSYYSLIERGLRQKKLDITLVIKLSKVLGVPIEKIIEYETPEWKRAT